MLGELDGLLLGEPEGGTLGEPEGVMLGEDEVVGALEELGRAEGLLLVVGA